MGDKEAAFGNGDKVAFRTAYDEMVDAASVEEQYAAYAAAIDAAKKGRIALTPEMMPFGAGFELVGIDDFRNWMTARVAEGEEDEKSRSVDRARDPQEQFGKEIDRKNNAVNLQRELLNIMTDSAVPQARYDAYCKIIEERNAAGASMRPDALPYGRDFEAVSFDEFLRWEEEQVVRNEKAKVKEAERLERDRAGDALRAKEAKESLKLMHGASSDSSEGFVGGLQSDQKGRAKKEKKGFMDEVRAWFSGLFGG